MRKFFTKEELISLLKNKVDQLGHEPTMKEIDEDKNMPSSITYYKRFGKPWNQILKDLGISSREFHQDYSSETMIELLKNKTIQLGHNPTIKEVNADKSMPSPMSYIDRFGSWGRALELAGLTPKGKKYSDKELLDMMKNKIEELGRKPTIKEVDTDEKMPSSGAYRSHFGSYRQTFTVLKNKAAR